MNLTITTKTFSTGRETIQVRIECAKLIRMGTSGNPKQAINKAMAKWLNDYAKKIGL